MSNTARDMSKISRRQMLSVAGLTAGAGIAASQTGCGNGTSCFEASALADSPPTENECQPRYVPISPDKAGALAYKVFPEGACMYATFKSIVSLISEKDPAAVPPMFFDMFKYGHGGCGAWGALCGGCNGGAAVIGLFHQDKMVRDGLIGQLFCWYETTELPRFVPSGVEDDDFPKAEPQSVLCHVSVNNWCKKAKQEPFGTEQKERCRRMTADVAKKVAELLNARHAQHGNREGVSANTSPGQSSSASQPPQSCIQCHSTPGGEEGSNADKAPKAIVRMDCSTCHDVEADHPR